jgi:hypothetical protein
LTRHAFSNRVARWSRNSTASRSVWRSWCGGSRRCGDDNRELRQQLAQRADENVRLAEKLSAARSRIEALLKQIPETES